MKQGHFNPVVEIQIGELACPETPAPIQKIGQFNQWAIQRQFGSVRGIGMQKKSEYVSGILDMRITHDIYGVIIRESVEKGIGKQQQVEEDKKINLESQRSSQCLLFNWWISPIIFRLL